MTSRTLYQKLWDSHVVADLGGDEALLYIDRQLVHEVSSPQAFRSLRDGGRRLRRPETHLAVADHAVPTRERRTITDPLARAQVAELVGNVANFDMPYLPLDSAGQGIVHVIGPESGFTLPGITLVCGDSHTTTHGAFGALAFGIGASECGTVMATQSLRQTRARTMRVILTGILSPWVSAKDVALALIAGDNFGSGSSREQAVWALSGFDIRCVVAPSFGEIFQANCIRNGVLPIVLAPATVLDLAALAATGLCFTVDLETQTIMVGDRQCRLAI